MKRRITILVFLLLTFGLANAAGILKGKVSEQLEGKILSGVNIKTLEGNKGTTTNDQGLYELELENGKYQIEFSYVGYEPVFRTINIKEGKIIHLNIQMILTSQTMDEIVVTASRTPEYKSEIPGRIEILNAEEIQANSAKSVDELLTKMAGVNVDRSLGIIGKSVVSIRGIVGGEQGRLLVLQDGVPINKTDGGSVNWNRYNIHNIEKIEVFKGPGSSIYGSNAMGGVINMIMKKNKEVGVHGFVNAEISSLNTYAQNLSVGGKLKEGNEGLYWNLAVNNRTSDGYYDLIEEERDEYSIKSDLKEFGLSTRIGYDFDANNNLEIEYNYYDDERGQGEKIIREQVREHDTHFLRGKWQGNSGNFNWNLSSFYQLEHYMGVREKGDPTDYTHWDIDSKRKEFGTYLNMNAEFGKHRLTFGGDFKLGKVDGADVYSTSTDIVRNIGSMDNIAFYFQDKYSVNDKFKITAGARFDMVNFHDGEFTIDGMTRETDFMEDYVGLLDEHNWTSFTPKAAIHYKASKSFNTYIAWSKGFRAPTLDDLCRTGFISGGFKMANPDLGPEKVNSYEWGANININNKLKIMPGIYFMKGKDFLYYLATGETIFGGRKDVLQKQNITEVKIFGGDIDVKYQFNENFSLYVNYTYTDSEIQEFEDNTDLEGMTLTYTPEHMINAGFNMESKIVNFAFNYHYQDKRHSDDLNTDEGLLVDFSTLDIKVWKEIKINELSLDIYFDINNLMDETYVMNGDQISMGRFVTFGASLFF